MLTALAAPKPQPKTDDRPFKVAIVGGGISGLSAAFRLWQHRAAFPRPLELVLLEGDRRLGGQIQSETTEDGLLERGPDSLLWQKSAARELCLRLGLGEELVYPGRPGPIHILHRKKIRPLPSGFKIAAPTQWGPALASPLFSWSAKWRMILEYMENFAPGTADESLGAFIERHFGREVLERVVQPILASIFLCDARQLSLRLTMPQLLRLERQYGSVTKGLRQSTRRPEGPIPPPYFSLKKGLSQLVRALVEAIPNENIKTGATIERVEYQNDSSLWRLHWNGGRIAQADALILACPAFAAAKLLNREAPELARQLDAVNYASCATINFVHEHEKLANRFPINGFFVPHGENLSFLACNFVHNKFHGRIQEGKNVLRVFAGGTLQAGLLDMSDGELCDRIHAELAGVLKITNAPKRVHIYRHAEAMPLRTVALEKTLAKIEFLRGQRTGLFLAGGGRAAVGIPDCIQSGEQAAEDTLQFLRKQPAGVLERAV